MFRGLKSAVWLAIFVQGLQASANDSPSSLLWYSEPASDYNGALPIGNGRIGAMIYGNTEHETIYMNEDSIWSGGFTNRINPNAKEAFPGIREKMDDGKLTDAGNDWLQNMAGTPTSPRMYQPACNLTIKTGHDDVQDFNRTLDISTGLQYVKYTSDGVTYERRAIANAPANVVAFQFSSSKAGSIDMNVGLQRIEGLGSIQYQNGTILLRGFGTDDDSYTFTGGAKVINSGGEST